MVWIRIFLGLLLASLASVTPLVAAGGRSPEPNVALSNAIAKLDREATMDPQGPALLADLLEKEFGTREEELKWAAMEQKIGRASCRERVYVLV